MLALTLGRYSQRISILQALANGMATRVRTHLEATLKLEPKHADAHIALGLYHAEIVAKMGSLLAGVTYQASGDAVAHALSARAQARSRHRRLRKIEYANGLLLLDAKRHREQADQLYTAAAACEPADAMEQLDVERAQRCLHGPAP